MASDAQPVGGVKTEQPVKSWKPELEGKQKRKHQIASPPPLHRDEAGASVVTSKWDARTPMSLQYLLLSVYQLLYTINKFVQLTNNY